MGRPESPTTPTASVVRNMENCIELELFSDLEPIPECGDLLDGKRFINPSDVANEMLRECRLWQKNNPGKDVMDIVTPDWAKYIEQNL